MIDSSIVLHSRCMKHLLDIDVLSSSGPPHDAYAEVRAREPVSWQEMPGVGGYWAVMKHADVIAVSRQPEGRRQAVRPAPRAERLATAAWQRQPTAGAW